MEDLVVNRISGNEIEIEFIGEGHTFYNLIKEYVLADERTEFAAYRLEHPLTANAVLYLRTKRRPESILSIAAARIAQDMQQIQTFFKKLQEDAR